MPCACNGNQTPAEDRSFEAIMPNGEKIAGLTEHEARVKATMHGGTWRRS